MKLMRYIVVILTAAFSAVSSAEVTAIPFDFSQRPRYGFFERKWEHSGSGTVERIEYALKRPYRQKMAIRVTDASGQTFQDDIPPASEAWVRHVKTMTARWPLHFGGAKDGVMHHPIRDFRILVLGAGKGEALVKDVNFQERLSPPAPVVTLRADMFKAEPPTELEVEVKAEKGTFAGGKLDIAWRDWDGNLVADKSLTCDAVPSGGVWRTTVPHAKRSAGRNALFCNAVFRLGAYAIEVEGPSWTAPVEARPSEAPKEDVPWGTGIYLHRWGNGEKAFAQMDRLAAAAEAAGIRWLREQIVWRQIEKAPGQLDFSKYDRRMDIVEKHGFRVCMLFGALARSHATTDADYPARYCEALRQAVRHYRGRVAAWEICNEPNLPWPMDPRWAANYRRLLPMATKVVHEEDPAARTVGCSASGLGVGFVKSLADETFDDVSIHPYRRFVDAREFLADLAEVRAAGKGRDIWITEIGWDSFFPGYVRRAEGGVGERPVSAHEYASLMARAHMVAAAAPGVRAVCGYDFVDDGVLAAGYEYHMGVVYQNVAPKPAYRALAKVFRHFNGGKPSIETRKDGLCVFRMGGKCAVWTAGAARRHVFVSRPVAATNLMDEPCAAQSVGGRLLYATDDRHPIFFEDAPGEIVPVTEGWENVAQEIKSLDADLGQIQSGLHDNSVDIAKSGYSLGQRPARGKATVCDADLPAGNIIVEHVADDVVKVRQDLRDSGMWFYWAFRVRGASGRTVKFDFTEKTWGGPVGVRGPVVSTDGGKTFSYPLDGKSRTDSFTYTFGSDEDDVQFYECHPYVRANWEAFVAKHSGVCGQKFAVETLCRSRKGADVPRARFGCLAREPKFRIFMSARHHCSETMASWVLEGVGEAFLADDDLGRWLRENVELMMVPFVDYDGAQAGDQGKVRKPHDHNRDYSEFLYPETKAVTEWIGSHAGGRLDVFIDVHCPWVRGKYNEWLYTPWKDPKILPDVAAEKRFSQLLEKLQCGTMRYRAADDLPFGKEWNKGVNYSQGWSGVIWACHKVKGLKIARSYEVPFANANGAVVTPETCRDLGRDTAKVFRAFLDAQQTSN